MQPQHIVIVGGGTSGWMAANMLAHQNSLLDCRISLVESDDIPTVGVGEGSTPFFKQFFDHLGISEQQWMPECHATYKTGIVFPGWLGDSPSTRYFHPFYSEIDSDQVPVFMAACDARRQGYCADAHPDSFFVTGHLYQQKKAPVNGFAPCDYGYHFDAGKLALFLRKLALEKGVNRHIATVQSVEQYESGDISVLRLDNGERIRGDLFIDCTGFRGLLIRQTLKRPFVSLREYLLCDAALAFPVKRTTSSIASATVSEAIESGWVWNIPLTHRTGSGLVYSREHVTEDQALDSLMRYHGLTERDIPEPLRLNWEPGKLTEHWYKNCVAIGLSQGFLEPLEAPMLNITQQSISLMIKALKKGQDADIGSFNQQVNIMIDGTCDYLQAHYLLNRRQEVFWQETRNNANVSTALTEMLNAWSGCQSINAVMGKYVQSQVYLKTSWYCLLSGLDRFTTNSRELPEKSRDIISAAQQRALALSESFPFHTVALADQTTKTMYEELNIA